jgi:hypothetical protein
MTAFTNTAGKGEPVDGFTYALIDHADSSPVVVTAGVPVVVGSVYCTESFATTPDIALYDGGVEVINLPTTMAIGDTFQIPSAIKFTTDLDVVIAAAGTAGKVVITYKLDNS